MPEKDATANENKNIYHGRINCARCGATSLEQTKPNRPIVIATNKTHYKIEGQNYSVLVRVIKKLVALLILFQ